jgi:hypothetical protein
MEVLPPRPEGALWLDGQWSWQATRWHWEPGGWVAPPPAGTYFAPWAIARRSDGALLFAGARWRDADGRDVDAPPLLARAESALPGAFGDAG